MPLFKTGTFPREDRRIFPAINLSYTPESEHNENESGEGKCTVSEIRRGLSGRSRGVNGGARGAPLAAPLRRALGTIFGERLSVFGARFLCIQLGGELPTYPPS